MSNHEHAIFTPRPEKSKSLIISYFVGLVASIVLVLIAYMATTRHVFGNNHLYAFLGVVAILTLIAQAIFFFRLNLNTDHDRWNLTIFLFSLLIMLIVISGSLWIMFQLNSYMML